MQKRSSKRRNDRKASLEEMTARIASVTDTEKNPAAVALGRLGGLKGGKARAKKLSAKRRSEIASRAAEARWKNASSR
jgi:hypothetical protein